MIEEQLLKYQKEKTKVKLNLKDGNFLTGFIKQVDEGSLVFIDKYQQEVLIGIESISYVLPVGGKENGNYG